MKQIINVVFFGMLLLAVACGNKDKGSSSNSQVFGMDALHANVVEGYFNPANSSVPVIVGNVSYQVGQQSNGQAINQALQQAQMNRIQPVTVNGTMMYRARITGFVSPASNMNNFPGQQPVPQQSNVLTITAIQFY